MPGAERVADVYYLVEVYNGNRVARVRARRQRESEGIVFLLCSLARATAAVEQYVRSRSCTRARTRYE